MSVEPQFKVVTLKIGTDFYNKIETIAKYLYTFSRQTPNPNTGKLEPILNSPSVEDFMGFATRNYFMLFTNVIQQEAQRQKAAQGNVK